MGSRHDREGRPPLQAHNPNPRTQPRNNPFRVQAGLPKARRPLAISGSLGLVRRRGTDFCTCPASFAWTSRRDATWTRKSRFRERLKLTATAAVQALCPRYVRRPSSRKDATPLRAGLNSALQQVMLAWAEPSIPSNRTRAVGEVTSPQPACEPLWVQAFPADADLRNPGRPHTLPVHSGPRQ
jgi:hypothetical protein